MTWNRVTLAGLAAVGVIGAVVQMGLGDGATRGGERADALVAHEWGTFTTFSGSDGTPMPFNTGVGVVSDGSLPEWVFGYASHGDRLQPIETTGIKDAFTGLVRMETPVIYFYSPRPTEVDVRVEFKNGVMTEFYPPPTSSPGPANNREQFKKAASHLMWEHVQVRPAGDGETPRLKNPGASHYGAARETDGDIVSVKFEGREHKERFLFYRGVADFELPVTVRGVGDGAFEINNRSKGSLAAAYLMEVRGGAVRFVKVDARAGVSRVVLPKEAAGADALADAMVGSLKDAGLYPKEALAMVNTWRSHWLGEPGTRVLYLVPRADVDAALPLSINPTPEKVERVFVGRAEVLAPETESQVRNLLAKMDATPEEKRDAVMGEIRAITGRFAASACERVRGLMKREREQAMR